MKYGENIECLEKLLLSGPAQCKSKNYLPVKFVDPVCGMKMELECAAKSIIYRDTNFHFCCPNCAKVFLSKPEYYSTKNNFNTLFKLLNNKWG